MTTDHRVIPVLLLELACLSCRDRAEQPTTTFLTYDSAAVRVTSSTAPSWDPDQSWTVSDTPVVQIGAAEGAIHYQLFQVRGAARLSDGRIVIANAGSYELRFYDSSGAHLASVGRQGPGPGEFEFLSRLWVRHDTIFVWDTGPNRLTVFDGEGALVRTVTLEAQPDLGNRNLVGGLADGTLVAVGIVGPPLVAAETGTMLRGTLVFSSYGPTGDLIRRLTSMPARQRYVFSKSGPIKWPFVPYAPTPVWAVGSGHLYTGSGARPEIEVYGPNGALQMLIRWQADPVPVTDHHLAAFAAEFTADIRTDQERQAAHRFLRDVPVPSTLPIYDRLLLDNENNLWVREFSVPAGSAARWWTFASDGRWMGSVRIPAEVTPLYISASHMVALQHDELGVECVVVHRLLK